MNETSACEYLALSLPEAGYSRNASCAL